MWRRRKLGIAAWTSARRRAAKVCSLQIFCPAPASVEARDLTEYKLELLEDNIARSGFSNITARQWDATIPDPSMKGQADVVLADLPCSGLGVLGRKKDIRYRVQEEDLHALAALQRQILTCAADYVKPGGTLVYSTCTINKEENEENLCWFTAAFSRLNR